MLISSAEYERELVRERTEGGQRYPAAGLGGRVPQVVMTTSWTLAMGRAISPEPHLFIRRCLTSATARCGYGDGAGDKRRPFE